MVNSSPQDCSCLRSEKGFGLFSGDGGELWSRRVAQKLWLLGEEYEASQLPVGLNATCSQRRTELKQCSSEAFSIAVSELRKARRSCLTVETAPSWALLSVEKLQQWLWNTTGATKCTIIALDSAAIHSADVVSSLKGLFEVNRIHAQVATRGSVAVILRGELNAASGGDRVKSKLVHLEMNQK